MQLDPDNETEYRRGGKIMKKIPRKFSAGGTPAPRKYEPPKPTPGNPRAPKLGDDDFVSPETQESMKRQKEEEKFDEAQRKRGAQRPNLGKIGFKKGGKIRKYEDGGPVDPTQAEQDAREIKTAQDQVAARDADMALNPNTTPKGRFKDDDTYSRAYNYVNKLRLPPGAAPEKDYEVSGGIKSAPKAAPRKFSASKPAPKSEPRKSEPKSAPAPSPKTSSDTSLSRGLGDKFVAMDKALRGATPGMGGYEALKKARDEAKAAYDKSVAKYARGGGVERKGKTAGKIVKMAKGGSVKGWGMARGSKKAKMV